MNKESNYPSHTLNNIVLEALKRKSHDFVLDSQHEHLNVIRFRPCVYVLEKYGFDVGTMQTIKEFKIGMTDMDLFERITKSEYINHCILRYTLYVGTSIKFINIAEVIEKRLLNICKSKYTAGVLHISESFKVTDEAEFFEFIENYFNEYIELYKDCGYEYRKYNLKINSEVLRSSKEDAKVYKSKRNHPHSSSPKQNIQNQFNNKLEITELVEDGIDWDNIDWDDVYEKEKEDCIIINTTNSRKRILQSTQKTSNKKVK